MDQEPIQYRDFKFNTKDFFDYAEKSGYIIIKRFNCIFILKKILTQKNVSPTLKSEAQTLEQIRHESSR